MSTIPQLGGYVCVRNGLSQDYCYRLAIESLLKICEEVVVLDSDSTDGTKEDLQRMARLDPRIKLHNMPWTDPKGVSHHHWVMWLNEARKLLSTKFQITLDADEVLHNSPECYQAIRDAVSDPVPARRFRRNNYWKSPSLVAPDGTVCGRMVVRLGFTSDEMPSDQPAHPGEYQILDTAKNDPRLLIHHLGFLRHKEAFYRKAKSVLGIWFNRYDPRLEIGEREGRQVWETECEFSDRLEPVNDPIPDAAQLWLADRGHWTADHMAGILEPEFVPPQVSITPVALRETMNVLHSGDLGDLIYAMAVFKGIGAVNVFVTDRSITKPIVSRLHLIEALLRSQPYLKSVAVWNHEPVHWNASEFRQNHQWHQSLVQSHLIHYWGQNLRPVQCDPLLPWIARIAPDPRAHGRVVVHRTARYNTHNFPWRKVVDHYGKRILFVGYAEEHQMFCRAHGDVEFIQTSNLLETAGLVAASPLVVANQSCVMALAVAMGCPFIQETFPYQPDCVYGRPNGQYIADGRCTLPDVAGSGTLGIAAPPCCYADTNRNRVPPGGWQYPGLPHCPHFGVQKSLVATLENCDIQAADEKLLLHNVARLPEFFETRDTGSLQIFRAALRNALR